MKHPTPRTHVARRRSTVVLGLATVLAAPVLTPVGPAAAADDCTPPAPGVVRQAVKRDGPTVSSAIVVRRYWGAPVGSDQIQATVATADLRRTRLVALGTSRLGQVATAATLTANAGALVGVNGDFFRMATGTRAVTDGVQVNGAVRYAPASSTAYIGADAAGRIVAGRAVTTGAVSVSRGGRLVARLALNAVNAPTTTNGVAVYTPALHPDNARRGNWQVLVRRGVITESAASLSTDLTRLPSTDRAFIVLGRGAAANALSHLARGSAVTWSAQVVDTATRRPVSVAIGSGPRVLTRGAVAGPCELSYRSRTMVAWSADGTRVWFVAVNSNHPERWARTTGLSHRQMGYLARDLGASEAVLLDGGGSTTFVGRLGRSMTRLDADPRRYQRQVADGLGIVLR